MDTSIKLSKSVSGQQHQRVRPSTFINYGKATFTELRNLMRNFSTFSLACLFYFTFGPKSFAHRWTVKQNKQASEKAEKFRIKSRRSVNVALLDSK